MKKTLTDISRRFSKIILSKKQKGSDNQPQETVKGNKKKDLEMQTISKPLTPVAQAVTDRLYNEVKISKGGPVKKSNTKATRGRGRSRKNSSVKIVLCKKHIVLICFTFCQKYLQCFLCTPDVVFLHFISA